jgi:cytochrome c biogenesis protein CcmG, thiol:disulfide interchange protein DsbE
MSGGASVLARWHVWLPVALFFGLAGLFGYQLLSRPVPSDGRQELPSALLGKPAPAFALRDLRAEVSSTFTQAELAQGRPVLLNFFASWCGPCRVEHPYLTELAQKHGVPVYAIAYKDKPEDAAQFLRELGDPFKRVGLDAKGMVGIDYGLAGVPETFVIDGQGKVIFRHWGPITTDEMRDRLLRILGDAGHKS